MPTIFNKFIPSCFRPGFKNDAEKTEQASGPQPGQASAPPHTQQRGERRSFFSRLARCFTPYDLAAKITKFDQLQAQANAELKRAGEQLNATVAEFNRMTEMFRNNGHASSSMPHPNGYPSSFSNFPSTSQREHTSRPQPSAPPYSQQTGGWASSFARFSTLLDPIAHITGFNQVRDQAYSQAQHASQQFNQVRDQVNSQAQQTSQQLEHIFNTMFMPPSPFNFAAHSNPNFHRPIAFTNPFFISSSIENNDPDAYARRTVEHLHQGGFSHAQLRELADDIKTLRENIGGTDVNNEIVGSLRQKYANVFLLQSEQDLASPVFEKMIPAIHALLDTRSRNTGN